MHYNNINIKILILNYSDRVAESSINQNTGEDYTYPEQNPENLGFRTEEFQDGENIPNHNEENYNNEHFEDQNNYRISNDQDPNVEHHNEENEVNQEHEEIPEDGANNNNLEIHNEDVEAASN